MAMDAAKNMILLERYDPPKNQLPSKVHRFPLYRRQNPVPAPAPPSVKEAKPEPPPDPKWSKWERIEGPQWDGFWRASLEEDGVPQFAFQNNETIQHC